MKMNAVEELCAISEINEIAQNPEAIVGLVLKFVTGFPWRAGDNLGLLSGALFSAVAGGRIKLYFDRFGHMEGYVVWAAVDDAAHADFIKGKALPDTNGARPGRHVCILDCLASRRALARIVKDVRSRMTAYGTDLTYFRIKGNRRMCKRIVFEKSPASSAHA